MYPTIGVELSDSASHPMIPVIYDMLFQSMPVQVSLIIIKLFLKIIQNTFDTITVPPESLYQLW